MFVSSRRYTSPEDVPDGHVTLKACKPMPASVPGAASSTPATCYDFVWDYSKDV